MTLKQLRKEEVVEEERLRREEGEEEREIEAEKVDDDLKDKQGDGDEKAEDAEGHMNDNDETTTPEKEPETHYGAKSAGQKRGNIMHDKSDILKHG